MGGSWGADVGALRELAGRLAAGADALRATLGQVDFLVGSSPWDGPDAEQFRKTFFETSFADWMRNVFGTAQP